MPETASLSARIDTEVCLAAFQAVQMRIVPDDRYRGMLAEKHMTRSLDLKYK